MHGRIGIGLDRLSTSYSVLVRPAVVVAALAILFLRMPGNFTMPQFWAEDGAVFFKQAIDGGPSSLMFVAAGYFVGIQRAVALVVSYLPPSTAPAIYNYFAFAFTLFAVWLATSPRLELPYRPLLALAIVVVQGGDEILGSMGNTQWIIPVVAMLLLLMRPAPSPVILIGEALLLVVFSVTGPFVVFLVPLTAALAYLADDRSARIRLVVLALAMVPGLFVNTYFMLAHPDLSMTPYNVGDEAVTMGFWLIFPFMKILQFFGLSAQLGKSVPLDLILGVAIVAIFATAPYRRQKLAMAFLGFTIMVAGMVKYRGNLGLLLAPTTTRYFYSANVFLIWGLCCSLAVWRPRVGIATVIGIEALSMFLTFDTPRIRDNYHWSDYTARIESGAAVDIPIAPKGWHIPLNQ